VTEPIRARDLKPGMTLLLDTMAGDIVTQVVDCHFAVGTKNRVVWVAFDIGMSSDFSASEVLQRIR
jgi:hypothetical protein